MAFIRCRRRRRRRRHAAQYFHYLYSINLAIRKVICPSAAVLVQKHAVQRCPSSGLGFQFKLCQTFRLNPGISAQF